MINSWRPYAAAGHLCGLLALSATEPATEIAPDTVSLAVVVQELIDADSSGIVFTADPVTGDDSMIEINAAWGLGEAIVGGQVSPDVSLSNDPRVE
jgi:pyruvate,water dikinase